MSVKKELRKAVRRIHWAHSRLLRGPAARRRFRAFDRPYKLHIGCGHTRLDGWVNIDIRGKPEEVDIVWDAAERFPLPDRSCRLIYSEHLLEHLCIEDGLRFLTECRRLLMTSGVVRIAMPSLEQLVIKYVSDDWRDQNWLGWPEYQSIQTPAEMLNVFFRHWGHQWLYDRRELTRRLREAGFEDVREARWGQSTVPELRERETREGSKLIFEAQK